MKTIVVSAVNITEAGPLMILRECLHSASRSLPENYTVIALVNSAKIIQEPRIQLEIITTAKISWFHRLYWEWFGFYRISRKIKPFLWLSLHDITPRIVACQQAVYCHNPSPFYTVSLQEAVWSPKFFFFNQFYFILYLILIRRNKWIIVQQNWIRNAFIARLGYLPIVVSHPSISLPSVNAAIHSRIRNKKIFFYPALPRVFKNIQTLCKAAKILVGEGFFDFEVILTISGRENSYSKFLYSSFSNVSQIKFIGIQSFANMSTLYSNSDVVVFPSKLETWGLPISEAKAFSKPLLVSDLPYAHEAVGDYPNVSFFQPDCSESLAFMMQQIIRGVWKPSGSFMNTPPSPYTSGWDSLWKLLITT